MRRMETKELVVMSTERTVQAMIEWMIIRGHKT